VSVRSGAIYPARWRLWADRVGLDIEVTPTMADQELDARASTGVVYWEGTSRATGSLGGKPVTGRGYVELTGYAPSSP